MQHTLPRKVGYVTFGLTEDRFCYIGVGKPRARMRDVYIKERDFDVKSLKSVYRVATFFCEKYEVG